MPKKCMTTDREVLLMNELVRPIISKLPCRHAVIGIVYLVLSDDITKYASISVLQIHEDITRRWSLAWLIRHTT